MFQEFTIIFSSQNIYLYQSYTQFCQGTKAAVPTSSQDWIIGNQKFQRDSLLNYTSYSVDKGFRKNLDFLQNSGCVKSNFLVRFKKAFIFRL